MEQYQTYQEQPNQNQTPQEPGIRQEEPFPVAPLRFGGIFGVGWQLYRRNFAAGFLLTLVLAGLASLLMGILMGPLFNGLFSMVEGIEYGAADITLADMNFLLFIPLLLLVSLVMSFLLSPMYAGTMYQEMHDRAEGRVKSAGRLLASSGAGLKKFYTTFLALMAIAFGMSFIVNIITTVVFAGSMFTGILSEGFDPMSPEGPLAGSGFLTSMIVLFVTVFLLMLVYETFVLLSFPVAAAENKKAFKAVGRSFKLVGKRFWRCIGVVLLLELIFSLLLAALLVPMILLLANGTVAPGAGMVLLFAVITLFNCIATPYMYALVTALYRDCAARVPEEAPAIPGPVIEAPLPEQAPAAQPEQPEAPQTDTPERGEGE